MDKDISKLLIEDDRSSASILKSIGILFLSVLVSILVAWAKITLPQGPSLFLFGEPELPQKFKE